MRYQFLPMSLDEFTLAWMAFDAARARYEEALANAVKFSPRHVPFWEGRLAIANALVAECEDMLPMVEEKWDGTTARDLESSNG